VIAFKYVLARSFFMYFGTVQGCARKSEKMGFCSFPMRDQRAFGKARALGDSKTRQAHKQEQS
jgi:hypothetical protein